MIKNRPAVIPPISFNGYVLIVGIVLLLRSLVIYTNPHVSKNVK